MQLATVGAWGVRHQQQQAVQLVWSVGFNLFIQLSSNTSAPWLTHHQLAATVEQSMMEQQQQRPNMEPSMKNLNGAVTPVLSVSALKAWSRFRFVRAGWFSAQEAIDYIK